MAPNLLKKKSRGVRPGNQVTITGIVYLDMLRQFLIPQADEDDQKGAFTCSKTAHPLITSEKRASTSTLVSQVGGLIERRR
jgi:hypothetical protein